MTGQVVDRARVGLLALSHAVDDTYQGAVSALQPFFIAERHYSYAAATGLIFAATALSSVIQPLFGILTDHRNLRWLVPAGLTLAGVGVGFSGLAASYPLTWLAIALSGIGVAAFHPEAARAARAASGDSQQAMSVFSVGGNFGLVVALVLFTAGSALCALATSIGMLPSRSPGSTSPMCATGSGTGSGYPRSCREWKSPVRSAPWVRGDRAGAGPAGCRVHPRAWLRRGGDRRGRADRAAAGRAGWPPRVSRHASHRAIGAHAAAPGGAGGTRGVGAAARRGGRLVTYSNISREPEVIPDANWMRARCVGYSGGQLPLRAPELVRPALLEAAELVSGGAVDIAVTEVFPLKRAADAHRVYERRAAAGKLVLAAS